jgi:hypothetical protein
MFPPFNRSLHHRWYSTRSSVCILCISESSWQTSAGGESPRHLIVGSAAMFSRARALRSLLLKTREFVIFIPVQFLAASRSSRHSKDAVDHGQAILVLMAHSLQPNSEHKGQCGAERCVVFTVRHVLVLSSVTSGRLYCGDSFVKGCTLNDEHHITTAAWGITSLLLRDCNRLPKNIRVNPVKNRLHNFC